VAQGLIADAVVMCVVDAFEPVEIDDKHACGNAVTLEPVQCLSRSLKKFASVFKSREFIGFCELLEI
jgi:hypothetical protein